MLDDSMPDESVLDAQPEYDTPVRGTVYTFLGANRFRVELYDGQVVDAALPEELVNAMRPFYAGDPIAERIAVLVELRPPPAMHRIVEVSGNDGWCGAARPPRR